MRKSPARISPNGIYRHADHNSRIVRQTIHNNTSLLSLHFFPGIFKTLLILVSLSCAFFAFQYIAVYSDSKYSNFNSLVNIELIPGIPDNISALRQSFHGCRPISLNQILNLTRYGLKFPQFGEAPGKIPTVVHYVYRDLLLAAQYEELMRGCIRMNPHVTFLLWTDDQAEKFVGRMENLPGMVPPPASETSFLRILQSYSGIEKSDVVRIMLLYYLGGVYMDLDMECRQPLHTFFKEKMPLNVDCIIDQEEFVQTHILFNRPNATMNNLMMCSAQNPFFHFIMRRLANSRNAKGGHTLYKTGPFLLTQRYFDYVETYPNHTANHLLVANPWWFSSIVDDVKRLEKTCHTEHQKVGVRQMACSVGLSQYKATVEERNRKAYLIHRYMHLGYGWAQSWIKKRFDVCQVMENLYLPMIAS